MKHCFHWKQKNRRKFPPEQFSSYCLRSATARRFGVFYRKWPKFLSHFLSISAFSKVHHMNRSQIDAFTLHSIKNFALKKMFPKLYFSLYCPNDLRLRHSFSPPWPVMKCIRDSFVLFAKHKLVVLWLTYVMLSLSLIRCQPVSERVFK